MKNSSPRGGLLFLHPHLTSASMVAPPHTLSCGRVRVFLAKKATLRKELKRGKVSWFREGSLCPSSLTSQDEETHGNVV